MVCEQCVEEWFDDEFVFEVFEYYGDVEVCVVEVVIGFGEQCFDCVEFGEVLLYCVVEFFG